MMNNSELARTICITEDLEIEIGSHYKSQTFNVCFLFYFYLFIIIIIFFVVSRILSGPRKKIYRQQKNFKPIRFMLLTVLK